MSIVRNQRKSGSARQRHLSDRLTLVSGEAKEKIPMSAQAVICIGASQIWGLPVEAKAPLNYGAALSAIRSVLEPGGVYFGTTGGQVYASPDGGDNWTALVRDLPPVLSVEAQTLS